jgi:L-gulonolactone oxidase
MAEYDGRPHWGKRHPLTHVELARLYPRFEDFRRVRAELDPEGAFGGPYPDRVLGTVDAR